MAADTATPAPSATPAPTPEQMASYQEQHLRDVENAAQGAWETYTPLETVLERVRTRYAEQEAAQARGEWEDIPGAAEAAASLPLTNIERRLAGIQREIDKGLPPSASSV